MMHWCDRCRQAVNTWRESYIEDGRRHITIMCKCCNLVLMKWSEAVHSKSNQS